MINDNDCDAVAEYSKRLTEACSEATKKGIKIIPTPAEGYPFGSNCSCPMLAWKYNSSEEKPISSSQFWSFVDGFDGKPESWSQNFQVELTFSKVFYDLGKTFREKALTEGF